MKLSRMKKAIIKALDNYYKQALAEAVKRGIEAKKKKICCVNKSKV